MATAQEKFFDMTLLDQEVPQVPPPQLVVVEPDTPQRLYLSGLFGMANGASALRDVPLNVPSVIVLGPTVAESKKALDEAEMILVSHPDIAAVLVAPGESVPAELMRWGMRANVKDVVAYEGPPDEIRASVDRAKQILMNALAQTVQRSMVQPGAQETNGKIVVVFSPKGGVGKSTLSINLAVQMAMDSPPDSVALIDADLQFGDVSIMLRVSSTQNLASIMESKDRINPETYRYACATHAKSGLRVLPAPADPAYADVVDAPAILDVLNAMRGFAGVTIVDTAPIVNELNILILEQADKILIPVNPDLPSVKNVAIVLKTLRALGIRNNQIGIILNKADRKNPSQQKEVEKTLDSQVIAVVPEEQAVKSAVNEGYPFVSTAPKSQATKAVAELAKLLTPPQPQGHRPGHLPPPNGSPLPPPPPQS
jgi:pilus assembly protein CpaE